MIATPVSDGAPGAPWGSTRLTSALLLVAAVASLAQAVLVVAQWDSVHATTVARLLSPGTVTGPFLGELAATIWTGLAVGIGVLGAALWAWLALASRTGRRRVRVVVIVAGCLAVGWFGLGFIPYWPVPVRVAAAVVPLAGMVAALAYRPAADRRPAS